MIGALVASVLASVTLVGVGVATAQADAQPYRTEYMPCATDEGDGNSNCVWDARHDGNGLGHSFFIDKEGHVTRLPHHIAHYLLHGDR